MARAACARRSTSRSSTGLQPEHDNFRLAPGALRTVARATTGPKATTGFIHEVAFTRSTSRTHPAPEDCEYYMCGPPIMNASVINMLLELGVEREDIMLDDFGG